MSQQELLEFAKGLSEKERKHLQAYLWMLERVNNPEWQAEMSRRLRRMKAGHGITDAEYYRRVRALDKQDQRKQRKRKAA